MQKEKEALKILETIKAKKNKIYVGHSGGKDSAVVFHLAKRVFGEVKVLHTKKPLYYDKPNGLTDVHVETLEYIYDYVVPQSELFIVTVPENFKNVVDKLGLSIQIDGTRRYENNREQKSSTFVKDGEELSRELLPPFVEKGLFELSFCYPLYNWTDSDVEQYIKKYDIKLTNEYKDDSVFKKYIMKEV